MNALIIATTAFCGPISPSMEEHQPTLVQPSPHHVAFAAFDGPVSALTLGSGDELGYELFVIEHVAFVD